MSIRSIVVGMAVTLLGTGLIGCSFSASVNTKNQDDAEVTEEVAASDEAPEEQTEEKTATVAPVVVAGGAIKSHKLLARLVGNKIEISQKVMFDYNKATIKTESHKLLTDVFTVISEKDSIKKIRIEGHTDSDGSGKTNKKLSQKRADSVKSFLVKLGVDASRLESVGYGEDRPVASNDDESGKEQNRRVEFNVVSGGKTLAPKIVRPIKK